MHGKVSSSGILIAGLSADARLERYFLMDPNTLKTTEFTYDIGAQRQAVLDLLNRNVSRDELPYGLQQPEDLLPYYLHPHSALQVASGEIIVGYKQAPYLRRISPANFEGTLWPPLPDVDGAWNTFGSTHCELRPDVIAAVTSPTNDQFERYKDKSKLIGATIISYDLRTEASEVIAELPRFALDTVHELEYSRAGFFVAVDMNLEIDSRPGAQIWEGDGPKAVDEYARTRFTPSAFLVYESGYEPIIWRPETPCSSHVDIDLDDPSVFYVSCNNISKRRKGIVIHGPGLIEKFRYSKGRLERLARTDFPHMMRITTHELFHRNGRELLAVTVYPNQLWVLSADDLKIVKVVQLFPENPIVAPCAASRSGFVPLYLNVLDDGDHVILTGASRAFVVSIDEGRVVAYNDFCEPGSFIATAHGTLVNSNVQLGDAVSL